VSYLLDTCVVSELMAASPRPSVLAWLDSQPEAQLSLSVLTIGELHRGIQRLPASPRRQSLEAWLHNEVIPRFEGRLIALDAEVMLVWGALLARLATTGRVLPAIDSLIAASALRGNLALVTRSVRDFEGTGVRLVNPWESEPDAR
jgi:tRNA(fMet)-specific endonuclease VapC